MERPTQNDQIFNIHANSDYRNKQCMRLTNIRPGRKFYTIWSNLAWTGRNNIISRILIQVFIIAVKIGSSANTSMLI